MQSNHWLKNLIGVPAITCGGLGSLIILIFICIPFLAIAYAGATHRSVMNLEDVVITTELAEDRPSFQPNMSTINRESERIYTVMTLQGVMGIPFDSTLWLRWYFEDEQMAAHYFHPNPLHPVIAWIKPQNEVFYAGKYRVEVYLDQHLAETVEFEVK